MPGGFHPFHPGHLSLYHAAQRTFPDADVYVAATNDTSERPFPFDVKEKLAKLAGVDPQRFVQVKSPFRAQEITDRYDPQTDHLIFVRSEKDASKPPQAGGVKKDGNPAYLQPLLGAKKLEPFARHAYMAYLPVQSFGSNMMGASDIRREWPTLDKQGKINRIHSLYPKTVKDAKLTDVVIKLLDVAILGLSQPQATLEATVVNDPAGLMIRPTGGLGTYNQTTLVQNLARQLTDLVAMLDRGNYKGVEYALYSAGVVEAKVRALARLQEFIAKQGKRPMAQGREVDIGEDYVTEKLPTHTAQ